MNCAQVLDMKGSRNQSYGGAWKDTNSWDTPAETGADWPVDSSAWGSSAPAAPDEPPLATAPSGSTRYRALYEFVARNQDEVSFQPGDIVMVSRRAIMLGL